MYKVNVDYKTPYKKNRHKENIVEDTTAEELINVVKSARFYNHRIIKENRQTYVNELIAESLGDSYDDYKQQLTIPGKIQKSENEIAFYENIFEYLKFIEKLPVDDYLLIINYLFDDKKDLEELMEKADVTTRQGLYKKVKTSLRKAFMLYSGEYFED